MYPVSHCWVLSACKCRFIFAVIHITDLKSVKEMCSGLKTLVKHKWEVQVEFDDDDAFWNQVQRVPVMWELSECAQVWRASVM